MESYFTMANTILNKHKKVSTTDMFCFYCEELTKKALYLPDGSEVPCCDDCYKKHKRDKR